MTRAERSKKYIEDGIDLLRNLAAAKGDNADLLVELDYWYDDEEHCHAAPWPLLGAHDWDDATDPVTHRYIGARCAHCGRVEVDEDETERVEL